MKRILLLMTLFIAACSPQLPGTDCTPVGMAATGEAIFPVTFTITPPAQVIPGEAIRVQFSGGMIVMPTEYTCGESRTYLAPTLPTAQAEQRDITVWLDEDQELVKTTCGYTCVVDITFPENIAVGTHQLNFAYLYGDNQDGTQVFTIEVVDNPS